MISGHTSHVGILALLALALSGYVLYYFPFDGIEITTFIVGRPANPPPNVPG